MKVHACSIKRFLHLSELDSERGVELGDTMMTLLSKVENLIASPRDFAAGTAGGAESPEPAKSPLCFMLSWNVGAQMRGDGLPVVPRLH